MEITKNLVDTLIKSVPGGCIAYRYADGRLLLESCSEPLVKTSGYTVEQLKSSLLDNPYSAVYADDRAALKQQIEECIENNVYLDCAYRVVDREGKVLWVYCKGKVLGTLDGAPLLFATIQNISSAGNKVEVVNNIPTGVGIYKVTDNEPSQIFLNDGYYETVGLNRSERAQFQGVNTLNVVHPDDRALLREKMREAFNGDGNFRVALRMMVTDSNDFQWLQLDARRVERSRSGDIYYVSFTNIDALKKLSAELEKNKATLEAALGTGNQMCCEYDPVRKTITSITGNNAKFKLPRSVENFPESLIEMGLFYPDDCDVIREAIKKIDDGAETSSCEARMYRADGILRWYSFNLQRYFALGAKEPVAICAFGDITLQKETLYAYQNLLDTVMRLNPDSISTFRMNFTQNICSEGVTVYGNILSLQQKGTVEGFFDDAEKNIGNDAERALFHNTFQRMAVLEAYRSGVHSLSVEHRYPLNDGHIEWIITALELARNPQNNDVVGVLYTKRTNAQKMSNLLLREALQKDYVKVAMISPDTDEYFTFNHVKPEICISNGDFWHMGVKEILSDADDAERGALIDALTRENVLSQLEQSREYTLTFEAVGKKRRRMLLTFSYTDGREIILATLRDITDAALLDELRYASRHDALTGLYNRETAFKETDLLLAKHMDEPIAVVHFDIQRFRLYNSFFSSKEGDRLLVYIADMFKELYHTHKYGIVGRIEADVFYLCFPYTEEVIKWNEQYIHNKLQQYRSDFYIEGASGVYVSKSSHASAEVMFGYAQLAAKASKKDQISGCLSYYNDEINHNIMREQRILGEMKTALNEEQFVVYLQPKYVLSNGKPYGAEALVRWQHPVRGLVFPDYFIPLFESNGFITELDHYMWEHVCRLLRKWLNEGKRPAPISVNVSRVSMYSHETVAFLKGLMERYRLKPDLLELELTESAYMDSPEEMTVQLRELQKAGFKIMMDDFGSGYSSLNTLRELPFDYLKVDRLFLASVDEDKRSRIVLSSVVRMAGALEIPVIAEGVETEKQSEFLEGLGCDYVQGYLFAKPMPVTDYEALIF